MPPKKKPRSDDDDDNDNAKVRKVAIMPKISAASTATIMTQWEKDQSSPVGTLKEKKELFKEYLKYIAIRCSDKNDKRRSPGTVFKIREAPLSDRHT